MMNKRILGFILMLSIAVVTFSIYGSSSADGVTTQPGSVDDPMVSKSYVDEQIKQQVSAQVSAKVNAEVTAQIDKLKKELPASSGGAGLTVVQLAQGQTLMAGAGSELIVRTGFVTAVSMDGNGIPDVTGGKDIAVKSPITTNHLLIFPTDKRGIKPNPKKSDPIFVMVRGGYKLLNENGSEVAAQETPAATPLPAATPVPNPLPNPTVAPVVSP